MLIIMKIVVLGTRGFPNIQGGVERHCEHLYPYLVKKGCEVIVFRRSSYVKGHLDSYRGVKLVDIKSPKSKFLEAFVHTFSGLLAAKKLKPDLVHIHAIGPWLCVPLARLLGFKVVATHHGFDYERKKWNILAKFILRLGEFLGTVFANRIICVSAVISIRLKKVFHKDAVIIPNGVVMPDLLTSEEALKTYGLKKGKYVLAVGRFVPEKGFGDLIDAFRNIQTDWKLVIAGDADHPDQYSQSLKIKAAETKGVVLTGFISGRPLFELYSHAGLFVLPSYHEGLPIVLLEAMSYGLSCVVSDIAPNKEVDLPKERFFKVGDIKDLSGKIQKFINESMPQEERKSQLEMVKSMYDWEKIADQTYKVYEDVLRM